MLYGYVNNVKWETGCTSPPCYDCKSPRFVEIVYVPFSKGKNAKKS